jgi:hypothetical protein
MDVFSTDDLVWFVAIDAVGPRNPVVVIVGKGAQALADDEPQLASILWYIGVRHRSFQVHSRHAEALLLLLEYFQGAIWEPLKGVVALHLTA